MTQTTQITQANNSNFEYNDYNRKKKYNQIYIFTLDELKFLNYTELRLYSVIRTLCNGNNYINIKVKDLSVLTNMKPDLCGKILKNLIEKEMIVRKNKEIILAPSMLTLDQIVENGKFLFWSPEDLKYNLNYREFKIFCVLRNYSSSFGYALIKPQNIAELLGDYYSNVCSNLKSLTEKKLVRIEKFGYQTRYYVMD